MFNAGLSTPKHATVVLHAVTAMRTNNTCLATIGYHFEWQLLEDLANTHLTSAACHLDKLMHNELGLNMSRRSK